MKTKRTLISGRKVGQLNKELSMTISSQCPDKWLFVDLETGDIWHKKDEATVQDYNFWRGANKKEMKDLREVMKARFDAHEI